MLTPENAREMVNQAISNLAFKSRPEELYGPIRYILSGEGKRLRPCLLLLACNLFSDDVTEAVHPAVGLEIFHNFTLLHDDIMDESPMRRNQPTVHAKWNRNIAILSGDVMAFLAYELIMKSRRGIVIDLLKIFSQTAREVCEGQQYDMNFENTLRVTEREYIEMIGLKTAALIAASLKMGAIIGGAEPEDATHLYHFGKHLGMAFQIQDDMLDIYGNQEILGKKIGGDIVANKKTYLLVKALELSSEGQHKELDELFNRDNLKAGTKIRTVKRIYDALGIPHTARQKTDEYFNLAFENLKRVNIPDQRKEELNKLAETLITRNK